MRALVICDIDLPVCSLCVFVGPTPPAWIPHCLEYTYARHNRDRPIFPRRNASTSPRSRPVPLFFIPGPWSRVSKFTFRVIESIYYSIPVARVPVAWRGVVWRGAERADRGNFSRNRGRRERIDGVRMTNSRTMLLPVIDTGERRHPFPRKFGKDS